MQTKLLLSLFVLFCSLQLQAQSQDLGNQIVGTWKMVSLTGTNSNGKPILVDLSKDSQYKIITPTHWMYVNFNQASQKGTGEGGTYELKGNKYIEKLTGATTEFIVKVEGDKYYQDGAILLPDGRKVVLHEVYERIAEPANVNNDLVGAWELVSNYELKGGTKAPVTGLTELQILTPTHYMWVDKKDGKFEAAMFGSYTREGNKVIPVPIIASFPVGNGEKVELTITDLKPNEISTTGKLTFPDGNTQEWGGTSKRVGKPKIAKAVSAK